MSSAGALLALLAPLGPPGISKLLGGKSLDRVTCDVRLRQ